MRAMKTMKPAEKGTKEMLTHFGPTLFCHGVAGA